MVTLRSISTHFIFNHTATTEIYTLSLHDALPICRTKSAKSSNAGILTCSTRRTRSYATWELSTDGQEFVHRCTKPVAELQTAGDRKSTRLNSSHMSISYAVFCLKKKKIKYLTDIY